MEALIDRPPLCGLVGAFLLQWLVVVLLRCWARCNSWFLEHNMGWLVLQPPDVVQLVDGDSTKWKAKECSCGECLFSLPCVCEPCVPMLAGCQGTPGSSQDILIVSMPTRPNRRVGCAPPVVRALHNMRGQDSMRIAALLLAFMCLPAFRKSTPWAPTHASTTWSNRSWAEL